MRPVTKPLNPPANTYDEAAETNLLVQVEKNVYTSKRDIMSDLNTLTDKWVQAGCPLTKQGKPRFAKSADAKKYRLYKKQIKARDRDWGEARRALIETLGAYCSYCSTPIYSHLAVEHVLPKNTFPETTLAYSNFLLACSSCNSIKGDKPSQATLPGAPLNTAAAMAYILNQTQLHYLWPDFNWNLFRQNPGQIAPFPFKHQLMWGTCSSGGAFTPTREVSKQEEEELLSLYRTKQLDTDKWVFYVTGESRTKCYFAVVISPDPFYSDDVKKAAQAVIDLVSLNRVVKVQDSNKTVDRRLYQRTVAWFRALEVRKELEHARLTDKQGQHVWPAVVEQSKLIMSATGFWGVWMQVLGRAKFQGNLTGQDVLRQCFQGTANTRWTV